jgi:hypothetical protein
MDLLVPIRFKGNSAKPLSSESGRNTLMAFSGRDHHHCTDGD